MIEIRFHGRGGQGTVVASKILANAVFLEGKFSQSFPAFGVERRGAPVAAFLRVNHDPIKIRTEIYEPDHIVILDPLLIDQVPLTQGLKPRGIVIINSPKDPLDYSDHFKGFRVATVPAGRIAFEHRLGSANSPIVNTSILGAVANVLGIVRMENLIRAIEQDVPSRTQANAEAARQAFDAVSAPVEL